MEVRGIAIGVADRRSLRDRQGAGSAARSSTEDRVPACRQRARAPAPSGRRGRSRTSGRPRPASGRSPAAARSAGSPSGASAGERGDRVLEEPDVRIRLRASADQPHPLRGAHGRHGAARARRHDRQRPLAEIVGRRREAEEVAARSSLEGREVGRRALVEVGRLAQARLRPPGGLVDPLRPSERHRRAACAGHAPDGAARPVADEGDRPAVGPPGRRRSPSGPRSAWKPFRSRPRGRRHPSTRPRARRTRAFSRPVTRRAGSRPRGGGQPSQPAAARRDDPRPRRDCRRRRCGCVSATRPARARRQEPLAAEVGADDEQATVALDDEAAVRPVPTSAAPRPQRRARERDRCFPSASTT